MTPATVRTRPTPVHKMSEILGPSPDPVWVRVDGGEDRDPASLGQRMIRMPDGKMVPLSTLARISLRSDLVRIERRDRQRALDLTITGAPGLRKRIENGVLDEVVAQFPGLAVTFL